MAKPQQQQRSSSASSSDRHNRPPRVVDVLVKQGSTGRSSHNNNNNHYHYKTTVAHSRDEHKRYDRSRKRRLPTRPKSVLRRRGSNETKDTLPIHNEKTVRFSSRQKRRSTISRHHMSPREHHAYWFQDNEFDSIQRRNERIIDRIETSYEDNHGNIVVASKNHQRHSNCPRGLERGLRTEYRTSEAYKLSALEKVLLEQEHQHREGIYDDVAISKVYARVARKSLFRAQTRALLDQKAVETNEFGLESEELDEDDDLEEFFRWDDRGHAERRASRPLLPGRKNRLKAKLTKMLRSRSANVASGRLPRN